MKPNKPSKEIIIVISVFIGLWLLCLLLMRPLFGNSGLDINRDNIHAIVGSVWVNSVMPAFLWLITIGYLIRAALHKFKNRVQNLILLISCAGLNILMLIYLKEIACFSGMSSRFNSVNRSLSDSHIQETGMLNYDNMVQTSFIIQVILIFLLSIIAAFTAKNWNTTKNAL